MDFSGFVDLVIFNAQTDASRSRQALFNEYLIAAIGVVTPENGPSKIWGSKRGVRLAKEWLSTSTHDDLRCDAR